MIRYAVGLLPLVFILILYANLVPLYADLLRFMSTSISGGLA